MKGFTIGYCFLEVWYTSVVSMDRECIWALNTLCFVNSREQEAFCLVDLVRVCFFFLVSLDPREPL